MYLGIDLGTSGVKVLLLDDAQTPVAQASAHLKVSRPHDLWSEQDPQAWVAGTEVAIDQLRKSHPKELGAVKGIGLSGQMHGATVLDASDQLLRPCILWNDMRSHAEAAELDGNPVFRDVTGNIVFPGFTAPKLVWLARHEPETFARIAKVLLPKDYLRLWLTGAHVAEMSDAAGTSWLNMAARDWSDDLLAATGLSRDQMPRLVEGSQPSGGLRKELAARWGMAPGLPVAGGAGDNAATAIGVGVVAEGDAFVSLGTSGVVFAATEGYRPNAASAVHTFCHAVPDTWHQMGVILSAAAALEWYSGIVGQSSADLTTALGDKLRAPSSVTFLPYLSGERTPHNDPHLTAGFDGVTHTSDRNALTHAVLEGVAFALRENADALAVAGTRLTRLLAVGGGSRSDYWLQMIATALNVPVDRPVAGDFGAAFGAARLGVLSANPGTGLDQMTPPAIAQSFEPDAALVPAYDAQFARFQSRRAAQIGTKG